MKLFIVITLFLFSTVSVQANPLYPCTDLGSHYVQATASTNFYIKPDECLISANKKYIAIMQSDGNFVVYPTNNITTGKELWDSRTNGNPNTGLLVQQDGHVVIYRQNGIVLGQDGKYNGDPSKAIWVSNPERSPFSDYVLIMQDDGNLVLYAGTYPKLSDPRFDSFSDSANRRPTTCHCDDIPTNQKCESARYCGCALGESKSCRKRK